MQSNFGAYHPSIWHFIDVLHHEQSLNELVLTQVLAGQSAPPQRDNTYKAMTARIQTVVADYDNRPILDFLRGIAHNIQTLDPVAVYIVILHCVTVYIVIPLANKYIKTTLHTF